MPSYVSIEGECYPMKEQIALKYPFKEELPIDKLSEHFTVLSPEAKKRGYLIEGDDVYYDGPCREAIYALANAGEKCFGKNFRHDQDFLQKVRNLNFNDEQDYLEWIGYDEKKSKELAEQKASMVQNHNPPKREEELFIAGGGYTMSGGKTLIGGFGEERPRSEDEVRPKRGRPKNQ